MTVTIKMLETIMVKEEEQNTVQENKIKNAKRQNCFNAQNFKKNTGE